MIGLSYTVADVLSTEKCVWGSWKYNKRHHMLVGTLGSNYPAGATYEIALSRCHTSAQKCDWLAQVAEKTWATSEILGDLVRALDATVGLRPEVGER